jgi:hypothetical protein
VPFPTNLALFVVKAHHLLHDLGEDTHFLLQLEPLMRRTTRNPELSMRQHFPLATSPQHIPDGVEHQPVRKWRSTSAFSSLLPWEYVLDSLPQRFRYLKVIDLLSAQLAQLRLGRLALCAILFCHDVSPVMGLLAHTIFQEIRRFV